MIAQESVAACCYLVTVCIFTAEKGTANICRSSDVAMKQLSFNVIDLPYLSFASGRALQSDVCE